MAYITTQFCLFCKRDRPFLNGKCRTCAERERLEEWRAWNDLDTDTKINKLLERIEKLEQGAPRY